MSAVAITFLPRVAFAAPNKLMSLRTGVQPGNKSRIVVEMSSRPSYSLSYLAEPDRLVIDIANAAVNSGVKPALAIGTLIKSISQQQVGDKLRITANLTRAITPIEKSGTMILEPNGDNDYRLVLDFVAGAGTAKAATAGSATAATNQPKKTGRKPIIVIDAGHGGKDPGCIGKAGVKEKDVVLKVSRVLRDKLAASGFVVHMTRNKDIFLNLDTRAGIAEQKKADLFISLHANANPSRNMKGFSIYTLNKKASDEEAQKLADAENASDKIEIDGFAKFEPDVRNALSSLQQHAVAQMSAEFANGTAKSFDRSGITQQPGPAVRHAAFAVLRSTIPGALVEIGHLSNAAEEKLLNSASHQEKIAAAIARAVSSYEFE